MSAFVRNFAVPKLNSGTAFAVLADILILPFAGGGIGNDRTATVTAEDTARKGLFVFLPKSNRQ